MSLAWKDFQVVNAAAALDLYERLKSEPASVDEATRALFETWTPEEPAAEAPIGANIAVIVGARDLAQAIRRYGHLAAEIDPLGSRPLCDPALDPKTHGVT